MFVSLANSYVETLTPNGATFGDGVSKEVKNRKKMKVLVLSGILLLGIPWTVAHQALLSKEFSRQEVGSHPFPRETFQPRDQTQISCIAGRFFTELSLNEIIKVGP